MIMRNLVILVLQFDDLLNEFVFSIIEILCHWRQFYQDPPKFTPLSGVCQILQKRSWIVYANQVLKGS